MNKEVLKELQLTELEILKEIKRICEKHNLTYFLMYGSLLGAVRHQGFIPWDDDIDIAMPRKDYQKFQEIALRELKDKFELDCIKTNKNYYLPFVKVRNKLTSFQEKKSINYQGSKGIWVDIFPLDYANKINYQVRLKDKLIKNLAKILSYKTLDLKKENKLFNLAIKLGKIIPNRLIIKIIDIILIRKKTSEKYLISYCDLDSLNNNIYLTKDIFPLEKSKFENELYNIPHSYKAVLTINYGSDYLKLPSLEKRITHKPLYLKFENKKEYQMENL